MNIVVSLDIIWFLASCMSIFFLLTSQNKVLQLAPKILLLIIAGISGFIAASNILEWSGITAFFDRCEDSFEILFPVVCIFFIFAFIQQTLRRELEIKNSEIQDFCYAVSHDLRSPLVTIAGFLGLLERDIKSQLDPAVARYLERIHAGIEQMENLIKDLLGLLRTGGVAHCPSVVRVYDLFSGVKEQYEAVLLEKGISLKISAEQKCTIFVDEEEIKQALYNLIDNGINAVAGTEEKKIELIGYAQNDDKAAIGVRDTGIGIDPAHHKKIFEIFQSLSRPESGKKSTGIGLAIVKKIVENSQGTIRVESSHGSGATFWMSLPSK